MLRIQHAYSRIALVTGIFLAAFFIGRLALFTIYHPSFAELSFGQVVFSFVHGIRFDASIMVTFIGIPFLFMILPHRWAVSRLWQGLFSWYFYLVMVVFVFLQISDLIYFGFVQRHAGPEVTLLTGDMELMLDMLLNEHRIALILFISATLGGGILWHRLFSRPLAVPGKALPRYGAIVLLFVAIIIVGRGGLQYKPARVADAFISGSTASGYLSLNGPFAIFHAARGTRPVTKQFMPEQTAISLVRKQITSPHETYIDDSYPLLRSSAVKAGSTPTKPNIVIFLLESWDAAHIDYFRKQQGQAPYSITPNFDELMKKGRLYSRFYAAGTRSMDGIAGTLAAVPTLPGLPYIGTGMDQNRLSYLAEFAKDHGYSTLFLQSSNRGSFRLDSIAAKAGFETYLGAEDIPPAHKDAEPKKLWGVWDYSTFMAANEVFAKQQQPFLGYIFSSSTHNPWRVPAKQWLKYPEDNEHHKYMNSLYYADWALGRFMAEAKKHKYFDNTIFFITGDHISGFEQDPNYLPSRYHIPLLVFGPGIQPGIDDRIGSQLDITPTIIDIARWKTAHSSVGRSLFDDSDIDNRDALCINGTIIDLIWQKSWMSHNLNQRLNVHIEGKQTVESLEQQILATHQVVMKGMLENRIYHKPTQATASVSE